MKTKQQLQRRILAHCRLVALKCSFKLPSESKDFSLPFKCFVSSSAQSSRLNRKLKAPLQVEFKDFTTDFVLVYYDRSIRLSLWIPGFLYNFVRKKVYFWCKVRSFYSPKLVLIVVTFSVSLHYFSKFFSSLIFHAEVVLLSWEKNSIPRVHKRFTPSVLVFFNRSNYMSHNVACSKRLSCRPLSRLHTDTGCSGLGGHLLFGWPWRGFTYFCWF